MSSKSLLSIHIFFCDCKKCKKRKEKESMYMCGKRINDKEYY